MEGRMKLLACCGTGRRRRCGRCTAPRHRRVPLRQTGHRTHQDSKEGICNLMFEASRGSELPELNRMRDIFEKNLISRIMEDPEENLKNEAKMEK